MAARPPEAKRPAQWNVFKRAPGLVLGFHGCDRETGEAVLAGTARLQLSNNEYDWLGEGVYFWEADPWRAMDFAEEAMARPALTKRRIQTPYVIGAVIDLGYCCNLLEFSALEELADAHEYLEKAYEVLGSTAKMPVNDGPGMARRFLDKAVVTAMHRLRERRRLVKYDSIRAPFIEGVPLYERAGFNRKNHIQLAIRDLACVRGYFRLQGL